MQEVETAAPVVARYVPMPQFVQLVPAVAYLPIAQLMQAAKELAPVLEMDLPATQLAQTEEAAAAAYMPAAQPTQPAEVDEPVVAKNVPAAQEVQEDAPVESA